MRTSVGAAAPLAHGRTIWEEIGDPRSQELEATANKVKNIVILGVGYVLGAKAGRARYDQIKQRPPGSLNIRARSSWPTPREQVSTRLPGSVTDRLPQSLSPRLGTVPSMSPSARSVGHPQDSASIGHDDRAGTSADVGRGVVTDAADGATWPSHD